MATRLQREPGIMLNIYTLPAGYVYPSRKYLIMSSIDYSADFVRSQLVLLSGMDRSPHGLSEALNSTYIFYVFS